MMGARKLNTVSLRSKFGTWSLALFLLALPLLNCTLPARAMTVAEKECCKKMANECGSAGMGQSHSCCPKNGSVENLPIVKAASPTTDHFGLSVLHIAPQIELVPAVILGLHVLDSSEHGPPGETPPTTVLRI